jgi:hypothetical protein
LANLIITESGYAENGADGVPPGNGCKSEREVLPWNLRKTFCDKSSFETGNGSVFVTLDMQDPFALDRFTVPRNGGNLHVNAFCLKGLELLMNCRKPVCPVFGPFSFGNRLRIRGIVVMK